MAFEITGKLHKKFDIEQKTDSFKAREFVIETEGDYPQFVKFQCTQERCNMVDNFAEGSAIKVSFDLRGREWQGKYFTNLNAWKIEGESAGSANEFNQERNAPDMPLSESDDYEELPF
jgi:single-strand DNA-binding protein